MKSKIFKYKIKAGSFHLNSEETATVYNGLNIVPSCEENFKTFISEKSSVNCALTRSGSAKNRRNSIQFFYNCEVLSCRRYAFEVEKVASSDGNYYVQCWSNKTNPRNHAQIQPEIADELAEDVQEIVEPQPNEPEEIEASSLESQRDSILRQIRENELRSAEEISGEEQQLDDVLMNLKRMAKIDFCLEYPDSVEGLIEKLNRSQLLQIFREVPKGGLLHCHSKAISIDFLLDPAQWTSLWQLGNLDASPRFRYSSHRPDNVTRYGEDGSVVEKFWTAVEDLSAHDPEYGERLKNVFHIGNSPSQAEAWNRFGRVFDVVGDFIENMDVFRGFFKASLVRIVEDGVQFVEIRATFSGKFLCILSINKGKTNNEIEIFCIFFRNSTCMASVTVQSKWQMHAMNWSKSSKPGIPD